MTINRRDWLLGAPGLLLWPAFAKGADESLWSRAREGGLVLLIRHAATEPGLGDPPGYKLDECATQRNLSETGREQARRLGERLKRQRIRVERVYTSPWCRCRETAHLAFGRSEDWEPLSSFFDFPDREADYAERVKQRITGYARREPRANLAMVTHNVNIAAITKVSALPAEIVFVRGQGCCTVRTVGRIPPETSHS